MATGVVSESQLKRLEMLSSSEAFAESFVVAMIHHNLHARAPRKNAMHGLDNRDEVLDRCHRAGVDLLLHGHTHVAHRFDYKGMSVIGCGSSTWSSEDEDHRARYNIYTVTEGRLAKIERRMFDPAENCFSAAGNLELV